MLVALIVVAAVAGMAVRLYLLTALAFDYRGLGEDFHRMFLLFLVVDELWALSPLLVAYKIGMGLAIAATVALAFLPFSQRTLMRMGYKSQTKGVSLVCFFKHPVGGRGMSPRGCHKCIHPNCLPAVSL